MNQLPNSKVKTVAIVVLLGVSGYLLARMLMPFFAPILWASLLAIFVYPLQSYLNSKVSSKNLAALLGVIITLSVIIVPVVLLFLQLGDELNNLYHRARDGQELNRLFDWFRDGKFANWLQQHFGISTATLRDNLAGYIERASGWAINYTTSLISNFALLIIEIFFITFTLFFLLRDGRRFLDWGLQLIPLSADREQALIKKIHDVIRVTLVSNFLVAGTQGGLAGLMFFILGVPGALLWTMVMSVLSMIPIFGSFMIWMPAAIWLLVTGHIAKGIVLLVWGVAVVGLVDNFMRPLLMGRKTSLETITAFYAVLGGMKLFGPIGLVLGPVVFVAFLTLIDFVTPAGETNITVVAKDEPLLPEVPG
jgi:predicted PurR-regulated permease PerM